MKKFYIILIALLMVSGASAQPCLPQGLYITTQAQIDNFQTNYPNCTEIAGSVDIHYAYGQEITNLNGLNVLTSIGGDLSIGSLYALTSLTGLDNLTSIGEDLDIYDNYALTSLTGLDNLTSIGGSLKIGEEWSWSGNPSLTSLTGLDNLTFIGGDVYISDNGTLTSLTGLDNLTYIGGSLQIGSGGIGGNNALTSLTGLESLTSIGGDLLIVENPALISLSGLVNLTTIEGWLILGWEEGAGGNPALTSLTGLDNIAAGSISYLSIVGNYSLSTCAVQSICDYLASPNGTIQIHDNSPGCNSEEEVDSACVYLSNDEVNLEPAFSIFPSPSSTTITISTPTTPDKNTHMTLLNINGQQLISRQIMEPIITFDISNLPSGIYVVKLTDEKTIMFGKFVKQ